MCTGLVPACTASTRLWVGKTTSIRRVHKVKVSLPISSPRKERGQHLTLDLREEKHCIKSFHTTKAAAAVAPPPSLRTNRLHLTTPEAQHNRKTALRRQKTLLLPSCFASRKPRPKRRVLSASHSQKPPASSQCPSTTTQTSPSSPPMPNRPPRNNDSVNVQQQHDPPTRARTHATPRHATSLVFSHPRCAPGNQDGERNSCSVASPSATT